MKSLILSVLIFCLVISFVIGDSIFISYKLDSLSKSIDTSFPTDKEDYFAMYICGENAEKKYNDIRKHLSLIYNEKVLYEFEGYISDIKSCALSESYEGALTAKNRLGAYIQHLRRFSSFSIEAVF